MNAEFGGELNRLYPDFPVIPTWRAPIRVFACTGRLGVGRGALVGIKGGLAGPRDDVRRTLGICDALPTGVRRSERPSRTSGGRSPAETANGIGAAPSSDEILCYSRSPGGVDSAAHPHVGSDGWLILRSGAATLIRGTCPSIPPRPSSGLRCCSEPGCNPRRPRADDHHER